MTSPQNALIVGDPSEDLSGRLFQQSFEARGVKVTWLTMAEALSQLACEDESLLALCDRNVPASALESRSISVLPTSMLRNFRYAAIVNSKQYLTYTSFFSRAVEACGVAFPNESRNVVIAGHKWNSYTRMRDANLPMPFSELVSTVDEAFAAVARLLYPVVVKDLFGARGEGVELARNDQELLGCLEVLRVDERPLLVQQYVECASRDKRVIYVDGEMCTAMLRRAAPGEFRSNLSLGGSAHRCEVSEEERVLSKKVVSTLSLDVAGLDIANVTDVLPGREHLPKGTAFCLEANPIPAFDVVYELNGVDGTRFVVDMMLRRSAPAPSL